ncbi:MULTISPECIES: flagellar protein FlbB [Rhodopseudomonas]|uniref:Flagellar protein FlbB n=1 Tax=Rhodopseudomonas palustris TaxID=1076 RepID=A0A0D7ELG6_RHOPL|nr:MULTISPECIES: flagellar protein FlbB [Rhodopseudomonas]KIZ41674.1 flagellar protein FlbB [Rhodopseudomonas palustris]MDF3811785.1 flagellar protein FlbB [Rhodopseudomonas sp. BAL398]WOK20255.1 flagellar protein FlbB [Rhodopseudomonas sp. BAL398]
MSVMRDIRLIPVVIVAVCSLAVLKIAGLVLDGGYVFDYQAVKTKPSWAEENFNFPTGRQVQAQDQDITGSAHGAAKKEEPKPAVAAPATAPPAEPVPEPPAPVSAAERAILERLQARRQELDARAREVEIRESLLKAAERRIESKAQEIKAVEGRIDAATEKKTEADAARFKGIITMYEGMKPKDAAKIFDRLEMPVLFDIASQIAPRKMSDILGQMSPAAAERLTVELARRANGDKSVSAANLPKIEGRPAQPNGN